jgi:CHAT domain-containing protein
VSRRTAALVALGALAVGGGCRAGRDPEQLFAEAEELRLRYEKAASHQAITKYQKAKTVWKRRGDTQAAARAAQGVGATYEQLGAVPESLRGYLAALSLAEQSLDRGLESEIRSEVGLARSLTADSQELLEEARRQCRLALTMARQAGSGRAEAKALTCLGEADYHAGALEHAIELYRQAELGWSRLNDQRGRAQALLYQGYVHSDLSQFDRARDCYDDALSLWTSLDDRRGRAVTLVAEARLRQRRGENQEALNRFRQALEIIRPSGDAIWEAASLTGIGTVYRNMADTDLALKYWERALEVLDRAGLKSYIADALISLGATYLATGDDSRALSRFERALALADELGNRRYQSYALRYLGVVHLFRGAPTRAQAYLERSLSVQETLANPRFEGQTRADMGEAHELRGEHKVAARHFEEALTLARAAEDRATQARGLFGLARASAGLNDLDAARTYAESALKVAESIRTDVESRDLRASYVASIYQYHELHMDVLMRLHRARPGAGLAAEAFEASERARARSLLDRLSEAGVDLRHGVDPELLKREQVLKGAFDDWAVRQRRLGGVAENSEALAAEYQDLEERYDQVQAEIRSESPRYAALVKPRPLSVKEVQKEVLDPETLLLEYALGDERSYLWAVLDDTHTSYELPPRAEIERAAERVYKRLTARLTMTGDPRDRRRQIERADTEYWTEAAHLSEMLLGPVATRMAGRRILVVADGALQYLPFAALPVPGSPKDAVPMIAEHEIVGLPSASVLAVLRRESRTRTPPGRAVAVLADPVFEPDDPRLVALGGVGGSERTDGDAVRDGSRGFPRLAATRQEAKAIVAAAPHGMTLQAIGFDASRAMAMSPDLARYRIVHFATHGVVDNQNPGLSGIALSMYDARGQPQDGFLRLHDIYGLELPAELVVLSACDTALGKQLRGEGLVGMVRGFMHAGAQRVVASLWKVDDEATGELMARFYLEMFSEERSPAAALRQAQLALWRQHRWRSPFYWAAFVLQGEWS